MRTSIAFVVATLTISLSSACKGVQQNEADVLYAVAQYQIKNWGTAADSYCFSIDRKDADHQFLVRLRNPKAKPKSACSDHDKHGRLNVIDKSTRRAAVIFDLNHVRWTGPISAEVDGGYYCGGLCAAVGTYHVFYDGRFWTVKDYEIGLIS